MAEFVCPPLSHTGGKGGARWVRCQVPRVRDGGTGSSRFARGEGRVASSGSETDASMNEYTKRVMLNVSGGAVMQWLFSLLLSPRRTLKRDRLARRRKLNAAFVRGRKVRRERTRT